MKKSLRICVFTFVYNRPGHVERSLNSLYKWDDCEFDHYVFDDGSNEKTRETLKELQKKYKFKLFLNNEQSGIYKIFHSSFNKLPKVYDYYIKFDSDMEVLSDNLFKDLVKMFKFPEAKISVLSPMIEGMKFFERNLINKPLFYGNHYLSIGSPIHSGNVMVFPKEVFLSFVPKTTKELKKTTEKWGVDSILYKHSLKLGLSAIVEDLSVYHIDNRYGQRRVYPEYFMERNRWNKADVFMVWHLLVSKEIYPDFIDNNDYDEIQQHSSDLEDFRKNCGLFLKNKIKKNETKI